MLNQRFNKTLAEIINSIIQKLTTSRKISINGKPTLLNAASIGNITSILIETANNDVSSRFWMEILEKINLILVQTNSKVEYSCSNCDCNCVNAIMNKSMKNINKTLSESKKEFMEAFGIDLTSKITELNETVIMKWYMKYICDPKWTYCNQESKMKWIFIGIGSATGFILIILLIFGYYVIWQKRKQQPGNQILILNNIIQNNESIVVNSHGGGKRNSTRNDYDWEQHLDILPKFDEEHITKGKLIGA